MVAMVTNGQGSHLKGTMPPYCDHSHHTFALYFQNEKLYRLRCTIHIDSEPLLPQYTVSQWVRHSATNAHALYVYSLLYNHEHYPEPNPDGWDLPALQSPKLTLAPCHRHWHQLLLIGSHFNNKEVLITVSNSKCCVPVCWPTACQLVK